MTATATVPVVFTGTPEQIIADVIRIYERRVAAYIAAHLAHRDWQLVEDLTQDTFLHLWKYHVARGTALDDRLLGLLKMIARQSICHHLRRMRSTEVAADFSDPEVAVGRVAHSAPLDTPHLASLYSELEAAKTELTGAADRYRVAARADSTAKTALGKAVRPASVERCSARVRLTSAGAAEALEAFQVAAGRVAEVRAEWDAVAADVTELAAGVVSSR